MAVPVPARPGQDGPGPRVHHVAKGVDHRQGPHLQALGALKETGAQTALGGLLHPQQLAHGGAHAGAHAAVPLGLAFGGLAGGIAHGLVRTPPAVAHRQVIDHRGGDDGHPGNGHIEPPAPLFQEFHGPPGGVQPKGAAAGDADAVHFIHHVQAHQGVHLAGPGGGTPDIGAPHGPRRAEDYGAAREILEIIGMAHQESLDPGNHWRGSLPGGRRDHLDGPARDGEEIQQGLLLPLGVEPLEPGEARNALESQQLLGQRHPAQGLGRLRHPRHHPEHRITLGRQVVRFLAVLLPVVGNKFLHLGVGVPGKKGVREDDPLQGRQLGSRDFGVIQKIGAQQLDALERGPGQSPGDGGHGWRRRRE